MKLNLLVRSGCASASAASLIWASVAVAQTTNPPSTLTVTNSSAGNTNVGVTNSSPGKTNVTKLETVTVVGKLDVARNQILPDLGATVYSISKEQIQVLPAGENAPFNQVLLRAPGIAQDSAANGDLHLRGEHANIQYRVNDVLLPEGITGFGLELGTRFVDTAKLITGALPAQYGFRTAGVVDIHTKSGAFEPGGDVSVYGGSFDTINPSFEYGGSKSNLNFYMNGSFFHSAIGIENPTASYRPIHDYTDQYKGFTYWSYVLDDTSRVSLLAGASYSDFEVPNTPGVPPGTPSVPTNVTAVPWNQFLATTNFDSTKLDENQNEQNYYVAVPYQKSVGDLNFQVAALGRISTVHFVPDPVGDPFFNGVASDVNRRLYSGGLQGDASYALGDKHTIRGGFTFLDEMLSAHTSTGVFPVDTNGNPTGPLFTIPDDSVSHALFYGVYLQDEWKVVPKVTLNYGARFDFYSSTFDHENQPSPRVNLIYEPTDCTTLHAGYARYFTPPPLENVNPTTVNKFDGTSNASSVTQDDAVKAERANYFDLGVNQKVAKGLQVGVDGYYKQAKNQLDDGLFGQTLILSAFNYSEGRVYGVEFTGTYTTGGFSTYANVALSKAQGKDLNSAQFLFDPEKLAYSQDHWIYLDHDQTITGSFGASYLWRREAGSTQVFVDALYGSGLRTDGTAPDGTVIPNGATVPSYYSISMGIAEGFKLHGKERFRARLDVVNITDNIYQLRNGSGLGVNAPQFGARLGFYGTLSFVF